MAEPNDQLRHARERVESPNSTGHPLSRQELAELVNEWVFLNSTPQRTTALDARYIGKLERGEVRWPMQDYRDGLRAVLKVNTDSELGFHRPRRTNATEAAVDRRGFLQAAASVGAAALMPDSVAELLTQVEPTVPPSVVGMKEIQEIRTAGQLFRNWDAAYGGGVARESVVAQLRYAARLLEARCPEKLRGELTAAVGRLGQAAAFMAFDAQANHDAQRIFRFALACAENGDDWHLRANILSSMARQAFWMDDADNGLTYIELAMVRSDRLTATERAMLAAVRARALAKLGRVQEAAAAVGEADDEFSRSDSRTDSMYVAFYDAAEHAGETGHALSDLAASGRFVTEASTRLSSAIEGHGDEYARSRTFCQIRLASQLMLTGDPREAAAIGVEALGAASLIRSNRVNTTLRELRQLATRYDAIPEVTDLRQQIGTVLSTP